MDRFTCAAIGGVLLAAPTATAQLPADLIRGYGPEICTFCEGWNQPQEPFRIFGNTYYVGTAGLSSILITSDQGHVLIDGGLPDSAPRILDHIRALGFDPAEVRLILNSHTHHDHAGGLAALEYATGAWVAATAASAPVLESGRAAPDDPQAETVFPFPKTGKVDVVREGEVLIVGAIRIEPHLTAGHTPGGTTWSWESCEGSRCLRMVYADSLTPVSSPDYRYGDHPETLAAFERGYQWLEGAACDVLLTPHPDASGMWDRMNGGTSPLVDTTACADYAATARAQLRERLEREG